MTQQNLNFGTTAANDGEDLFSAFTKIQANFVELYAGSGTVSHAITDVASAATCDIGAAATDRVRITGSVTITSFGTSANKLRFVHFDAALTLTYNATTLILPDAVNKPVEAGDAAIFSSDASGNWRCLNYYSADDDVDSSDVTFTQSGTGAVERTALAKMRDVVHVLDYIPVAEHAAILAKTTTTNLATYIQAAIDYVDGLGGGYVEFGYGLYVSGPLVLKDRVVLRGKGPQATEIKLANSSNASFIVSESFSTLQATTNQWTVAQGMPVWLGLWGMRVNGNKANQNAGNAVNLYAKALILGDLIVYDAYAVGIYSEGGDIAGQADWYDLPEGLCGPIFTRNCGSHGWHMRGPHDISIPQFVSNQNGGDGIRVERSVDVYSGQPDFKFAHIYANTGKGVRVNSAAQFHCAHLIAESNHEEGFYSDGSGLVQIAMMEMYLNCLTSGSAQWVDTSASFNNTVGQLHVRSPGRAGVGGVQINGDWCNISDMQLYGDGASETGIGLEVMSTANFARVSGVIRLYSGTASVGFKSNSGGGHQHGNFQLTLQDCTNGWYHGSGGSYNHYEIHGFFSAGDVALHASSATPFSAGFETGYYKGLEDSTTHFEYGSTNLSNGTVALPSLYLGADRDTGFYSPGVAQMAMAIAGANMFDFSATGLAVGRAAAAVRRLQADHTDASNNAVTYLLRLLHATTGTPGNGIGAGIEFVVEANEGNNEIGATIEAIVTDTTSTSEDFDLVVKLMAAGATAAEVARFLSTGGLDLGGTTDATLTRSGAGNLSIEGNVIYRAGGTDVPVTDGGTGASSARLACQNLSTPYMFGVSGVSVAHTGTVSETILATIAVDAGAFGANGFVDVEGFITAITNNANAKTIRVRFGASGAGTGGTTMASMSGASVATYGFRVRIANSNDAAVQHGGLNNGSWGGAAAAINTAAIDTTAATEIVISAELANTGDSLTLRNRSARLVYAA